MEKFANYSVLIGALIFSATTVLVNFKKGSGAAAKEVIDLREKQISAFRDEITQLRQERKDDKEKADKEMKEFVRQIGELTGNLTARDGEIKRLTDLITKTNPEMNTFFKECGDQMKESREFTKNIEPFFKRIADTLDKLEEHIK